jgi:hypothetical protein
MKNIPEEQIRILERHTIDCCDVEAMMGEYADGNISPSLKDRLDDHISNCSDCKEFKESYLMTIKLAKELKPAPLNTESQNRLRRALNERLGINLSMVEHRPNH